MEGANEKVLEANAIIYDKGRKTYVCPLCRKKKAKVFKNSHLNSNLHVTRLDAFYSAFLIIQKQPFCKLCDRKFKWNQVKEHAIFHKIRPYWEPEDKHQKFFANFMTRVNAVYYCHLCDEVMKNWSDAWSHLEDERHLGLRKKIGEYKLEKDWEMRCSTWLAQGITPAPENRIECRMCDVTMHPSEAESHIVLPGHVQKKLFYREDILKRAKQKKLDESTKPLESTQRGEKITSKFPTCSMICNFSIAPDFSSTSTISESEQVESNDDDQADSFIDPGLDLRISSNLEESSVVEDRKNFEYLVSEQSWIINISHPLLKKLLTRKRREQLCPNAATQVFYCLLCCDQFFCIDDAKKHASDENHANSLKNYGTNSILMSPGGKYHCGYCDSSKNNLEKMYRHLMNNGHIQKVAKCDLLKADRSVFVQPENPITDHINTRLQSKDLDQISAEPTASSKNPEPSYEDSPDKSEPKDPSSLNLPAVSPGSFSQPTISNWILDTSEPLFSRIASSKLRKKLALSVETQLFYCLICFNSLLFEETAQHISSEHHAKTLEKFGCDRIVLIETSKYHCTCCDRQKNGFEKIYEHVLSDGHAKRLGQCNGPNNEQSALVPVENQSDDVRPKDSGISQPCSMSPSLSHEETAGAESLPEIDPRPSSNSMDNGTDETFEFHDEDLNWVVGYSHPLYGSRKKKNLDSESAKNSKKTYCIICPAYYSKLETAKAHISSSKHTASMEQYGCHYIEVTPQSKYRCVCCNFVNESFQKICYHVKSDDHIKKAEEMNRINGRQSAVELAETNPDESERRDVKSSEAPRNISKNFEFREIDVNWVVSREHPSCVQLFRTLNEKLVKNTGEPLFFCLLCKWPVDGDTFDAEAAKIHISSEMHADSMEKYGSRCIELTPKSTYQCTCCNCQKDSFDKIFSHTKSDSHVKRFQEFKRKKNEQSIVESEKNKQSSRNESEVNDRFDLNFPEIGSKPPLISKISPTTKETVENLNFLDTFFEWVIDSSHKWFKSRTVKVNDKKLCINTAGQSFHCRICFADFPDAETVKNHIIGPEHANSMEKYGCRYIEKIINQKNFKLKLFCICCNRQKKNFARMYAHVMSDTHINRVREMNHEKGIVPHENETSDSRINNSSVEQRILENANRSLIDLPLKGEASSEESKSIRSFPNSQPLTDSKASPTTTKPVKDLDYLARDLNWVIDGSHAFFRKRIVKESDKTMSTKVEGEWFYCLICSWPDYGDAFDLKAAKAHVLSAKHSLSMEKYACGNIEVIWNHKYRCICCNRQVDTFDRICDHLDSHSHVDRVCNQNRLKDARVDLKAIVFSQDESRATSNLANIIPGASLDSRTTLTAQETAESLNFLRGDLDWVIKSSHSLFKNRARREHVKKNGSNPEDQKFHCLICSVNFVNAAVGNEHISSEEHADSIERYGCDWIKKIYTPTYRCRCCSRIERDLKSIHRHIMSDFHAKTVQKLALLRSQQSMGEAGVVCGNREPRRVVNNDERIEDSSLWKDTGPFSFDWPPPHEAQVASYGKPQVSHENLSVDDEPNDWFSRNFPKINLTPSTQHRVVNKTGENFEFHDEDLNWVVDNRHTLYKMEKSRNLLGKATKNMGKQFFYCLICFDNFFSIETAKNHISCEEHEVSMKQFGCHFIEVMPGSKYHCVCCNREKNRFYKIYNHIMSEAHMDRLCEINGETNEPSTVELDNENNDDAAGLSLSENSESFSTGWPASFEKSLPSDENMTLTCDPSTSSLVIASCIFVSKKNAKKSFCHICEDAQLPIATKNLEDHINSMRHKLSLKRYGCDNIEIREDGSHYCACCDCRISNLQNVYLHVKDKKHMSSLIKAKPESRRLKKVVTRKKSPDNSCKLTGKALLSDFIEKKIEHRGERLDDDFYELVDSSQRYNILPRYTGNIKNDMEKCHSIPGQSNNSKQPLLNSMLVTMADELSRLSNQIEDTERTGLRDKNFSHWMNHQADKNNLNFTEIILCEICNHKAGSHTELHAHMAKHFSEEFVAMKNSRRRNESFNEESLTENNGHSREFDKQEYFESANPQSSPSPKELTDSLRFDRSMSEFSDSSSSGSDNESGDYESEENDAKPGRDLERYLKLEMEVSKSTSKVNFQDVIQKLMFKDNYIYDLEDKLDDLKRGLRMSIIIDNERIYCLICRVRVSNTLKDYYTHLWSLDHCNYLDVMENDAEEFANFPDQFSDLDLANEYMEEISDATVCCYLCNKSVDNEDESLRDHIYENDHERACAHTRSNALTIYESMKSSLKCDWYGIERYSCFPCGMHSQSEVHFVRHLNGRKHLKKMLESPNFERKMLLDFCPNCAVLWYGYRSSHFYHVNEVDAHEWLANDGFYLMRHIPKSAQLLLRQPENWADQTIRHLDAIRPVEISKGEILIDDLEKIVRLTFPRAKAYTFGSRVNGLYSEDSDIDIFLDCSNVYDGKEASESNTLYFIKNVHKCLSRHPETWDICEVLTNCRSPIIRTYHQPTGLSCDLSFDNGLCVEKTKLIKRIVDVYPAFRKLVVILKMWMAYCDLSGSERIAHNSLYWLVIFYLQNETILPNIATLISMKNKSKIIAGWEVGVSYDFDSWEPDGSSSIKDLLQRFFTFYTNFDFRYDVACPLLGEAIKKLDFVHLSTLPKEMTMYARYMRRTRNAEIFRFDSPMCIQDPFDLQHNVTKAVRKNILNRFRTCCSKSLNFMALL